MVVKFGKWGSVQDIKWLSDNVLDVKIDLSLNNGVTWTTIVDSTPSTGIYNWVVQAYYHQFKA